MNFPSAIIPGAREPGRLSTFGAPLEIAIPEGPSTMDAVTIAEHQREGGGAPSQRRRVGARRLSTGAAGRLQEWLLPVRVLLARQFRTNDV